MAVTTTYALVNNKPLDLFNSGQGTDVDMTELANGGLLATAIDPGVTDRPLRYDAFNSAGQLSESYAALQDLESASVTTLANGNLVIAALGDHDGNPGGDLGFTVLHGVTRGEIKEWTFPVIDNASNVQVEALADGGFVVACETYVTETDHDISMRIYDNAGNFVADPTIDRPDLAQAGAPTLAALDNGRFAVSWHEPVGADYAVMTALLTANGLENVQSAHSIDGNETPGRVQSVATDDGYAIVYEDGLDLLMVTFDGDGQEIDWTYLTDNKPNACRDVSLTRLDNGLIAYTYSYDFQPGDHDVYMQIIDPATLTKLFAEEQIITQELDDERDSVIQDFGLGKLALGWDVNGSSVKGTMFDLQRTTLGDNAANLLAGDESIDLMSGGRGADTLNGGDNNDHLRGQGDKDVINGGRGNDLIVGGGGVDILSGQRGKDVFTFEALTDSSRKTPDRIMDLSDQDRIDLKAIDADAALDGDQKFHLVDAFTDHAREAVLKFQETGKYAGDTVLDLDVDGDGVSDFRIVIEGDHADFTRFAF